MQKRVRFLAWGVMSALLVCEVAATDDLRLIEAVRHGNREAIKAALQQNVNVNATQADRATALHWAAYREDAETVGLLIRAGADFNAVNDLGVAPLYLACDNGNGVIVEMLLKAGADPHATLPSGETALMTAARAGSVEAVKALIARGASVNAREKRDHQTALMWAASQSHPRVVEELIAAGADVNARSDIYRKVVSREMGRGTDAAAVMTMEQGGYTPLLFASRNGDARSARLLLAAGADVNVTTPDGASALAIAAHSGQTAVAMLLLENGADPNAARAGYAPLHLAVLRADEVLLNALLARGADPNARVTQGTLIGRQAKFFLIDGKLVGATPYFLAAKYTEAKMMRILANAGSNPRLGLPDGTTTLMAAAGALTVGFARGGKDRRDRDLDTAENEAALNQDEDIRTVLNSGLDEVKLDVELGADVNAANNNGDTALHAAAALGYDSVIKFLVSKGAKVDVKNKGGRTPLMIALSKRDNDDKAIATQTADLLRKLENGGQ